ncbi:hypothetical protein DEO72_LG8g978 [Vigna unguiculata]|uniref:Uncharacterized protein n=1 Tax=Vigna unguiculata TaxID=3917 RepID=A0A4D6MQN5_VIGUN|nr:hypothetical protein DEO72_LG8g978 [Vigna unguiculata]
MHSYARPPTTDADHAHGKTTSSDGGHSRKSADAGPGAARNLTTHSRAKHHRTASFDRVFFEPPRPLPSTPFSHAQGGADHHRATTQPLTRNSNIGTTPTAISPSPFF